MQTSTVGGAITYWRKNPHENIQQALTSLGAWAQWEAALQAIAAGSPKDQERRCTETLHELYPEIEEGQIQLRTWLLYEVNWLDDAAKCQTVRAVQALLIRQLAKLNGLCNDEGNELLIKAKASLEATLVFLEETFPNHLEVTSLIPANVLEGRKAVLKQHFQALGISATNEDEVQELATLLTASIEAFLSTANTKATYAQFLFYENLLSELSTIGNPADELSVREILYYLNNNDEWFVEWECSRLLALLSSADNAKHKTALLKWEQKWINQVLPKPASIYDPKGAGLHEQMNRWIDEEVKYLESGYAQLLPDGGGGYNDKIHTSLSVAKLAVIIRLLVIDKIIINRTIAPMLRVAAKMFTTLQKDEISFGSLESKYHSPDKATVNAVRDMLFKWINILAKL